MKKSYKELKLKKIKRLQKNSQKVIFKLIVKIDPIIVRVSRIWTSKNGSLVSNASKVVKM